MGEMASQITSPTRVYSTVYSGADQRKHQSSASLAFVRGIHRGPMNSPHKGPVTRKMFPFDDVIMSKLYVTRPQCVDPVWSEEIWPLVVNRLLHSPLDPTSYMNDIKHSIHIGSQVLAISVSVAYHRKEKMSLYNERAENFISSQPDMWKYSIQKS